MISKLITTFILLVGFSLSAIAHEFTVPPELKNNVVFWENVFEHYGRQHYLIHDDVYLNLVYKVVDSESTELITSPAMKKRLAEIKLSLQKKLKNIAHFPENKLTSEEKILKLYIIDVCGEKCIKFAFTRVRTQRGIKEKFSAGVIESQKYNENFISIFREAGVPEDLVHIPHVESSFMNVSLSKVGAAGIWQFMPRTAKIYGLKNIRKKGDERLHPLKAAAAAAKYLKDAHVILGSWELAINSYNVGVGGMSRAKKMCGGDLGKIVECYKGKRFKFASRNYYSEVIAARNVAKRHELTVVINSKLTN